MQEKFPKFNIDLNTVRSFFIEIGCTKLFVKELAWNHDAKRQIYLATDLTPFNQFPNKLEFAPPNHRGVTATKKKKAVGKERIFGHLDFYWVDPKLMKSDRASSCKLIFYPQYPETRLSGFLRGTTLIPSRYLREKSGETYENRLLFLGTDGNKLCGFLAVGHKRLRDEVRREPGYGEGPSLYRLELNTSGTSEQKLISALESVHKRGWLPGKRLKDGKLIPCKSPQAVGFTLEAQLGITPNSNNAPDFEGYEVKTLTVNKPGWNLSKAVTLMTPEPDTGIYTRSIQDFLSAYGYPDRNGKTNRQNFGGVYRCGDSPHHLTGLLLSLVGYSPNQPQNMDTNGQLQLVDRDLIDAAAWSFTKLLKTWSNKHEKAVYIQALKRKTGSGKSFKYLNEVQICEGADFLLVLKCLADGIIYLDPAVKAESWQKPGETIKKRNQFRIAMKSLAKPYQTAKFVKF